MKHTLSFTLDTDTDDSVLLDLLQSVAVDLARELDDHPDTADCEDAIEQSCCVEHEHDAQPAPALVCSVCGRPPRPYWYGLWPTDDEDANAPRACGECLDKRAALPSVEDAKRFNRAAGGAVDLDGRPVRPYTIDGDTVTD